ncbi:hypothetical protein D3C87_1163100 [compost metagenome]
MRAQILGFIQLQRLITLGLQVLDLLRPARRRQQLGAPHLRQCQRGTAHRPATDHQQAGFGVHQAAFQRIPRRGVGHPKAGGLSEAQMRRFEGYAIGRQFDELRVGAIGEES